jgi:hypothetical protein
MSLARFNNYDNDETPLLRAQSDDAGDAPHKQTPLPATQISVLVLPWIAESIVAHSISPYINQVRGGLTVYTLVLTPNVVLSSLFGNFQSWVGMCGR